MKEMIQLLGYKLNFFSSIFCKELVCKKVAVMICAGLVPREIILISGCTYKLEWPAKEIMTGIKRTKFNPNIRAKGPIEWGFFIARFSLDSQYS